MKKYSVLVLAMSTLSDPTKNKSVFDNRYVFRDKDGSYDKKYHAIGQMEPVPQYIIDKYGELTHCIILQTPEVKKELEFNWDAINGIINSDEGDNAPISVKDGEKISAVDFFEKRVQAFYRKKEINNYPEFIPIDMCDDDLETGLAKLLDAIRKLYGDCLKENERRDDDSVWQLFVDVHGSLRTASLAMFALIQTLSAPDEQDLITGRDMKIDAGIARLTDGKGTVPVSHVYTVNYDPNKKNPKEDPHTIVDKTEFFQIFTKASLEAYMNYGQYAQLALKSTVDINENNNPPYAFISYRRMDAPKERFAFLGVLKKEGFNYWYDDSIELQADWSKTLKKANCKSTVFIALITKNYYDSYQCLKELKQALDEKKPICFVSLDQTDLYSPEQDLKKEIKETVFNEKGEVIGEKTVPVTITKKELKKIIAPKNHLALKDLLRDGVFQVPSLKDKLNELCEKNEAFRSIKTDGHE